MNSQDLSNALGLDGLFRFFSAKREFPDEFHTFLYSTDGHTLNLDLNDTRFPFIFRDKEISINKAWVIFHLKDSEDEDIDGSGLIFDLSYSEDIIDLALRPMGHGLDGLYYAESTDPTQPTEDVREPPARPELDIGPCTWTINVDIATIPESLKLEDTERLNPDLIQDVAVVLFYILKPI